MIKVNIDVNSLCKQTKCELISFLYRNYEEIGYDFLEDLTGLAPSTVRNYRWLGDQTLTEDIEKLFAACVKRVEGGTTQRRASVVRYEREEDYISFGDGVATTYICEIFGNDSLLYTKPGKSVHLHDRMKDHSKNKSYGSDTVVVKKVYAFEEEQEAYIMESMVLKYLKKCYKENYVRNDRFSGIKLTEENMEKIEEIYRKVVELGRE